MLFFRGFFGGKSSVPEANKLEPRSGPKYVRPDVSFNLFEIQDKRTDTSVSGI